MSSPALPAAAPKRSRVRRLVTIAVAALVVVVIVALLGAGAAFAHAKATPDFWTYVKERRANDELAAPIRTEKRVIAHDGELRAGEGDPFGASADARDRVTTEIVVKHGDEVLLRVRHAVAWTLDADGATRTALAMRTEELTTHEGFRARVRIGVDAPERLAGPSSARAGAVTYDVTLLAGGGPSTVELVEIANPGNGEVGRLDVSLNLLDRLVPWSTVPEDGLVHRVRQKLFLMASRSASSSQSIGYGDGEHAASTSEYSYDVETTVRSAGGTRSWRKATSLVWADRVW